jgi:hypothetical protein
VKVAFRSKTQADFFEIIKSFAEKNRVGEKFGGKKSSE